MHILQLHGGPNFPNLLQIGKIVPNLQKQIGKAIANWERLNFLQIGKFFPNLQLSQFVESQIGNLVPNLHKCQSEAVKLGTWFPICMNAKLRQSNAKLRQSNWETGSQFACIEMKTYFFVDFFS